MSVKAFIESFPMGDVGIIAQFPKGEASIRLNREDFNLFIMDVIKKASLMGLLTIPQLKPEPSHYKSCPIPKPTKKQPTKEDLECG